MCFEKGYIEAHIVSDKNISSIDKLLHIHTDLLPGLSPFEHRIRDTSDHTHLVGKGKSWRDEHRVFFLWHNARFFYSKTDRRYLDDSVMSGVESCRFEVEGDVLHGDYSMEKRSEVK